MEGDDEATVDEAYLDALSLEAASYLRRRGGALGHAEVIEELGRKGVPARDAVEAIDHGLRSGALVLLGADQLDAGIVRGFL